MFDQFEQQEQTCWIVLNGVGRFWMKFDFVQTFHPTLSNIFVLVIKIMGPGTEIQHCWIVLD